MQTFDIKSPTLLADIKQALKNNCFEVYMNITPGGVNYRVIGARKCPARNIHGGEVQIKTISNRARNGYLWWTVSSNMNIYQQ